MKVIAAGHWNHRRNLVDRYCPAGLRVGRLGKLSAAGDNSEIPEIALFSASLQCRLRHGPLSLSKAQPPLPLGRRAQGKRWCHWDEWTATAGPGKQPGKTHPRYIFIYKRELSYTHIPMGVEAVLEK